MFSLVIFCQSNEVQSSYHCEKEGLTRCLNTVGADLIGTLVTDRHRQIAKYIREDFPDITHLFDIWHVAKGAVSIDISAYIYFVFNLFFNL